MSKTLTVMVKDGDNLIYQENVLVADTDAMVPDALAETFKLTSDIEPKDYDWSDKGLNDVDMMFLYNYAVDYALSRGSSLQRAHEFGTYYFNQGGVFADMEVLTRHTAPDATDVYIAFDQWYTGE